MTLRLDRSASLKQLTILWALCAHRYRDLSIREIARRLGMRISVVRGRLRMLLDLGRVQRIRKSGAAVQWVLTERGWLALRDAYRAMWWSWLRTPQIGPSATEVAA